jgi:hypothetical protein
MSRHIDNLFWLIKWPVALISLALLPSVIIALWTVLSPLLLSISVIWPFLLGCMGYLLGWWFFFRRPGWGSWFSTLEHEITHSLVALLTFHPVTGIRTSWRQGGHMTYLGKGNWLISIAPYFIPTLSLLFILLIELTPLSGQTWIMSALGASIAYHITSTWIETHSHQSDLQKVGWIFSGMFLPTANILIYGAILGYIAGGYELTGRYLNETVSHCASLWTHLFGLFGGGSP